jgi:putative salt-induced outer membrane protein YdiY
MTLPRTLFSAAFLVTFHLALYGDQITLKNGDRYSGSIVQSDQKTLILKTEFAGEVKIDRSAITGIVSEQVLNVAQKDGPVVQGRVTTDGPDLKVQRPDGATTTIAASNVTALRDEAAQKAWMREDERLNHPKLNDFWTGSVTFGLANSSGNSKTTTISTVADASRVAGKNKISFAFAQLYSTQSTTQPYGATAQNAGGGVRLERDISKRLFLYGANTYYFNRFQDLDLRVVAGGGLGFHAWKSKKGYLDIGAGANWNREQFGMGLLRNSAELNITEEFSHQPYKKLKFFEQFAVFPNLTDTGNYRMVFLANASVPLVKWLEWSIGFTDNYLSNPQPGFLGNDTVLSMGVRVSFDQTKR